MKMWGRRFLSTGSSGQPTWHSRLLPERDQKPEGGEHPKRPDESVVNLPSCVPAAPECSRNGYVTGACLTDMTETGADDLYCGACRLRLLIKLQGTWEAELSTLRHWPQLTSLRRLPSYDMVFTANHKPSPPPPMQRGPIIPCLVHP